jgi:hypothetical protein
VYGFFAAVVSAVVVFCGAVSFGIAVGAILPGCPIPPAQSPQETICRAKGRAIIFEAPTCHEAVTALEWLVLTDPDCKAAGLEGGVVTFDDCPDGGGGDGHAFDFEGAGPDR